MPSAVRLMSVNRRVMTAMTHRKHDAGLDQAVIRSCTVNGPDFGLLFARKKG